MAAPEPCSSSLDTQPAFDGGVSAVAGGGDDEACCHANEKAETDSDDEDAYTAKLTQPPPKPRLVLLPAARGTDKFPDHEQQARPPVELYYGINVITRPRGRGDNERDDRAREFGRLDLCHEFGVDVLRNNGLRIAEVAGESTLSRRHAAIWVCKDSLGLDGNSAQAFVIDMGSTNGTFVNGVKISSHGVSGMKWAYQLRERDEVRFGRLGYVVHDPQKRSNEEIAEGDVECGKQRAVSCNNNEELGGKTSEKLAPPLVRELTSDHENGVSNNGLSECWVGETSNTDEVQCTHQELSRNCAADSEGVADVKNVEIPEICSQSSPQKCPLPNQASNEAKNTRRKRSREVDDTKHSTLDRWMKSSKAVLRSSAKLSSTAKLTKEESVAAYEKHTKNICLGRSVAHLNLVDRLCRLSGWKLIESVYNSEENEEIADVLVESNLRRSEKILTAIALGVSIVSPRWVEASATAKFFTPVESYILNTNKIDRDFQNQYSFNLWTSICKARREKPLLRNYIVTFTRTSYERYETQSKGFWDKVVAACGGKIRMFSATDSQNTAGARTRRRGSCTRALQDCDIGKDEDEEQAEILIALESDIKLMRRDIKARGLENKVYSPELLLTGILRQKLDFSQYQLCTRRTRNR